MNCRIFLLVLLSILPAASSLAQQDYSEILELHKNATKEYLLENKGMALWTGTEIRNDTVTIGTVSFLQSGEERWQLKRVQGQMTYTETFTGESGWLSTQSENFINSSDFIWERPTPFRRIAKWKSYLGNAEAYQYEPEYLGTKRIGPVNLMEFRLTGKQYDGFMLYLDPETHLIHHIRDLRIVQGKQQSVEVYFSDYREVEGALLPFRYEIVQRGQSLTVYQFDTVEFDPDLSPDTWQRPSEPRADIQDPADVIPGR